MRRTGNYDVIVSNIGTVRADVDEVEAHDTFNEYVEQSKTGYGRASGESVTIMHQGEIVREYVGTIESTSGDWS